MKLIRLLSLICASMLLSAQTNVIDDRVVRLESYLKEYNSPVAHLASLFVMVADDRGLDWRLLPALAVVESSAGKAMKHNNLFGWASGKKHFRTTSDAIVTVADALGTARWYRDKTLVGAMRTYNPANRNYPAKVTAAMKQIDSEEPIAKMLVNEKLSTCMMVGSTIIQ